MQYYSKNASLASNLLFPRFAPFFECDGEYSKNKNFFKVILLSFN